MKLPSNYTAVTEEELCYLEGGNTIAKVADIAATVLGAVYGLVQVPTVLGIMTSGEYHIGDVIRAYAGYASEATLGQKLTLGLGFGTSIWSAVRLAGLAITGIKEVI